MTTYEVIEEDGFTSIRKTNDDGKVWVIPNDPANSDYAEYLRYTEWVEAGNNPDDFWTQEEI